MKQAAIYILLVILSNAAAVTAQTTQIERSRKRMEASSRASAESERAAREAARRPTYPPAKMNIDVQMALTTGEVKDFAEAKPLAVSQISDGDPLWLYIKFNGALERYVHRIEKAEGPEEYVLFVEIGPQGEMMAKNHYIINFEKADLKLTELKISLSPGANGHIRAMPIFLRNAAKLKPGRWHNEIRVTDRPALPRGPNEYLAKAGIFCDFSKGLNRYSSMMPQYDSMVIRGTTEIARLPIPGKFYDFELRGKVIAKLKAEGIKPTSVYFAGDGWAEYSDSSMNVRQSRNIFAVFKYTRVKNCLYGVAEIVQEFDPNTGGYGNSSISLQKDFPVPCTAIK